MDIQTIDNRFGIRSNFIMFILAQSIVDAGDGKESHFFRPSADSNNIITNNHISTPEDPHATGDKTFESYRQSLEIASCLQLMTINFEPSLLLTLLDAT